MSQIVIQFEEDDNERLNYFISDIRVAIQSSSWKPEQCTITEDVI